MQEAKHQHLHGVQGAKLRDRLGLGEERLPLGAVAAQVERRLDLVSMEEEHLHGLALVWVGVERLLRRMEMQVEGHLRLSTMKVVHPG